MVNPQIENGYIKLYRKSIDSKVFKNDGLWRVWTWCLMKANHKEAWLPVVTGRGSTEVHLLAGQFLYGRKTASKELDMKESTIRNRIAKLKKMQNLDVKVDTHFSIISIINWDIYQSEKAKEDRQEDRQRTGKGQAKDTDKNDNNDKNDKNLKEREIIPVWLDEKTWSDFIKFRVSIKEKMSEKAEKLILNKLSKLRDDGNDPKEVLEESIMNGWKGVFPLKKNKIATSNSKWEFEK